MKTTVFALLMTISVSAQAKSRAEYLQSKQPQIKSPVEVGSGLVEKPQLVTAKNLYAAMTTEQAQEFRKYGTIPASFDVTIVKDIFDNKETSAVKTKYFASGPNLRAFRVMKKRPTTRRAVARERQARARAARLAAARVRRQKVISRDDARIAARKAATDALLSTTTQVPVTASPEECAR